MKKTLITLLFGFFTLVLGSAAFAKKEDTLFQVATYNSLQQGIYDGEYTFRKLKKRGDFGVGTFQDLDGDMVALDGRFYKIQSDGKNVGRLKRVDWSATTPFAEVIFFHPFRESNISSAPSLSALEEMIVERLPNKNIPYAIEIDEGSYRSLTISSLRKQSKPYRPLRIAARQQAVKRLHNTSGTLVGFWFPKHWGGITPPGLYLNFINSTHTKGGHVLNIAIAHGTLKSEPISNVEIALPRILTTTNVDDED